MGNSLGFFEISGVVAAVNALDLMVKAADVEFVTWEKKLGGRLVTVIVRGEVSAVRAAIEAADIVLMDDEPLQIAKAIRISRKCIGIVYENIVFALAVKFACLVLVAIGLADMWAAIFADVGVMVLAVLNAIRALRVKK